MYGIAETVEQILDRYEKEFLDIILEEEEINFIEHFWTITEQNEDKTKNVVREFYLESLRSGIIRLKETIKDIPESNVILCKFHLGYMTKNAISKAIEVIIKTSFTKD